LLSPRAEPRALADFGERSAFVTGQRVGRARRAPRAARPRGRRSWRAIGMALLGAAAAAALASGGVWLLTSPRFEVTHVDVRGTQHLTAERVLEAARVPPGRNLFLVDPRAVVRRVETLPEVERAEIVRELPDRLTIVVEERRPFTLVHAGRLHWIDERGHVLGPESQAVTPPAPIISGLSEAELLDMKTAPSARAREAIRLIRALLRSGSALATEISEIDVSQPDGPVLYTVGGIEVRLGADEWDERLARLEGVLAQTAAREGGVRMVDLRFRDQVVLQGGR
jgi:cell division septal protein FtsQ